MVYTTTYYIIHIGRTTQTISTHRLQAQTHKHTHFVVKYLRGRAAFKRKGKTELTVKENYFYIKECGGNVVGI